MYVEYENKIKAGGFSWTESQQGTDLTLSTSMNILLITYWLILCLLGLAIMVFAKSPVHAIVVIAAATLPVMVIKPTFALCLVMLILPTGSGISHQGSFSLDRGVGIALALSFALNFLITSPQLRIRNKALWAFIPYFIWCAISPLWSTNPYLELKVTYTQIQLCIMVFLAYLIIETNPESTFRWTLRSYVIGCLGSIILSYLTGTAEASIGQSGAGRYGATVGEFIDENLTATFFTLAFFTAIYLFIRDKNLIWRILYLFAMVILPLMIIWTGSRGSIVALILTITSPVLFLRQISRKPILILLVLLFMVILAKSTLLLIEWSGMAEGVSNRLTNAAQAEDSIGYRLELIRIAIFTAVKYPLGTAYYGWSELSGSFHVPHSDLFFVLGIFGFLGAGLLIMVWIMMLFTVKRMPLSFEKLYARAVMTYLLIMGMDIVMVLRKHMWIFFVLILVCERISHMHIEKTKLSANT